MLKSAIRLALLRSDSTIAPLEAAKLGGTRDAYKKYFKDIFFFTLFKGDDIRKKESW